MNNTQLIVWLLELLHMLIKFNFLPIWRKIDIKICWELNPVKLVLCVSLIDVLFCFKTKPGPKEDLHKRCVHFYACICAFASDEKLQEEFEYYINLDANCKIIKITWWWNIWPIF